MNCVDLLCYSMWCVYCVGLLCWEVVGPATECIVLEYIGVIVECIVVMECIVVYCSVML